MTAAQPSAASSRTIVVGVDGSEPALHALHCAVRMAELRGARLEAVFAYLMPPVYAPLLAVSSADELHEAARAALRTMVDEAFPDDVPKWTALVAMPSDPAYGLLSRARNAELVVIGSRGHGGMVNLLLGSVAAKIVEHAHCPVLVVRPETALDLSAGRRIVVGVDGSASARAALRWAADLARRTGAGIDALIAFEPPLIFEYPVRFAPPSGLGEGDYLKVLEGYLADALGPDRPRDLRLFAKEGFADEQLVTHAHDAALLVIGNRGRGGFAGLLLGSTSARCVQHSPCPVVVVHEPAAAEAPP